MKLDFSEALSSPGKEFDFTFEWKCDKRCFENMPHQPLGDGIVDVKYHADDFDCIIADIVIRIPFDWVCDKCASSYQRNLFISLQEKIEPETNDAEGFTYDRNDVIDMDNLCTQIVLTSFPHQNLCSPNCKGLCTHCGINLNYDTCDCSSASEGKNLENNPFAKLLKTIAPKKGGK